MARIRGSRRATRRGVKARLTSARSCVWRGRSVVMRSGTAAAAVPVVACRKADHDALARDEEIRRLERVEHVGVAGERPEPQSRVVMDGELVPEPAIDRIGVLVQLRIVGVELHGGLPGVD